jgi:hypothetical protein
MHEWEIQAYILFLLLLYETLFFLFFSSNVYQDTTLFTDHTACTSDKDHPC